MQPLEIEEERRPEPGVRSRAYGFLRRHHKILMFLAFVGSVLYLALGKGTPSPKAAKGTIAWMSTTLAPWITGGTSRMNDSASGSGSGSSMCSSVMAVSLSATSRMT